MWQTEKTEIKRMRDRYGKLRRNGKKKEEMDSRL